MCTGWNAESDNNTQFQLNSLMCDLYLRDCFLDQSQVSKSLAHFVCIYTNITQSSCVSLCITLLCIKQMWYYGASQLRLIVPFLCVSTFVSSVCFSAFVSLLFALCLTDLEDFKTHRRSPVRVREGQGVVLLCGPPPHSGGKLARRVAALIAILLSQWFPLQANISPSRSAKSWCSFCSEIPGACYHFSSLLSSSYLSGQSGRRAVCWIVEVSGLSHFYFATLWPVSPVFCWAGERLLA